MNPSLYQTTFERIRKKAMRAGLASDAVLQLEKYINQLLSNGALPIMDVAHLALLLGFNKNLLYSISNAPSKFYRTFSIPKRDKKTFREISEPLPTLKEIQQWILSNVLSSIPVHPVAKAYVKGGSIRKNAKFHLRQETVIRIDVRDFFPSITKSKVFLFYFGCGYTEQIAMMLSELCCQKNCLPQGAPTSGALSNLIFRDLDAELFEYCKQKKIRYTRYADDLCFSGVINPRELIENVRRKLAVHNFEINDSKTAVLKRHARQMVTGVVVNEKMQSVRSYRRKFRQEVYYIRKYGLEGHLSQLGTFRKDYLSYIIGVGAHILSLNPSDDEARRNFEFLKVLRDHA